MTPPRLRALVLILIVTAGAALQLSGARERGADVLAYASTAQDPTADRPAPRTARRGGSAWTPCGTQGLRPCRFEGRREVRFVAGSTSRTRTFWQQVECSPRRFGVARGTQGRCAYGRILTRTLKPAGDRAPAVRVPVGPQGSARERVRSAPAAPRASKMGAFRVRCEFSHMSFDDPIVFPGRRGAAHLHAFLGNTRVDADTALDAIPDVGRSTCAGGVLDRTAYWVPALVDSGQQRAIAPLHAIFYYKSGSGRVEPSSIQPIPANLRMIAGNMRSDRPQGRAGWDCMSAPGVKPRYFKHSPSIPTDCPAGSDLAMVVHFPQCWDGRRMDSADHMSHMAYPRNGCPASHPVALPAVSYKVFYRMPSAAVAQRWRLSSDMYDTSLPAGFSGHADFVNGWDEQVQRAFLDGCVRVRKDCGGRLLGDGRELF